MREIIETASVAGDRQRLAKFGRFLGPWIIQMERENPGILHSAAVAIDLGVDLRDRAEALPALLAGAKIARARGRWRDAERR
jgi:hypothetical protein